MIAVRITRPLLDLFAERRIFHRVRSGERWAVGQALIIHQQCRIEPYATFTWGQVIPRGFGAFSYSHSELSGSVTVGRYCSIASELSFLGDAHPTDWATSSPTAFDDPRGALRFVGAYLADRGIEAYPRFAFDGAPAPVTIGNDVWIGAQAMIAGGVTIGDGAVIGARSTVTRDVPPYAVMVGTPARVIRMRFPEPIVERLLATRWWRHGPEVVQQLNPQHIERFLDAAEALDAAPLELRPLTYPEILEAARRQ